MLQISNLASTFRWSIGIKADEKFRKKWSVGVSRDCPFFGYPLLSQERGKLRISNFACTFMGSIGTEAHNKFGKSSRVRCQGLLKIFRAPIHRAHRVVIFAIAQLSCSQSLSLRVSEILPLLCSRTSFSPTPPLVSPKFPHVPLGVGGWPLGYEEQRCWANCPCN